MLVRYGNQLKFDSGFRSPTWVVSLFFKEALLQMLDSHYLRFNTDSGGVLVWPRLMLRLIWSQSIFSKLNHADSLRYHGIVVTLSGIIATTRYAVTVEHIVYDFGLLS